MEVQTTEGNITMNSTESIIAGSNGGQGNLSIQTTRIVLYCIFTPLIITIGVFGNTLTICVLNRLPRKTPSTIYLTALAFSDLSFLITRAVYTLFVWGQLFFISAMRNFRLSSYFFLRLSFIPERTSSVIIMTIVLERVVTVWGNISSQRESYIKRSKIIIATVILVVIGIYCPHNIDGLIFELEMWYDESVDSIILDLAQKEGIRYTAQMSRPWKNYLFSTMILFQILPIAVVFVCNLFIVIGIKRTTLSSSDSVYVSSASRVIKTRRKQNRKMTRMLLVMSIAYLALCGPYYMYLLLRNLKVIGNTGVPTVITVEIFKTVLMLNNAFNFILYGASNAYFRKKLSDLAFCRKEENDDAVPKDSRSSENQLEGSTDTNVYTVF